MESFKAASVFLKEKKKNNKIKKKIKLSFQKIK